MVTWFARNPECPECFHEPHDDEPCLPSRRTPAPAIRATNKWRQLNSTDRPSAAAEFTAEMQRRRWRTISKEDER